MLEGNIFSFTRLNPRSVPELYQDSVHNEWVCFETPYWVTTDSTGLDSVSLPATFNGLDIMEEIKST